MELKGQTVYVLLTEGQYPGNASLPEVFADEADANARKAHLEAYRHDWSTRQVYWCDIEEMTIQ